MILTTHYFTGDLMFTYLHRSDRIPSGNNLKCVVKAGISGNNVTKHITKLVVYTGPMPEYSYLAPEVKDSRISDAEAAEIQECAAGRICEVICMFGGRSVTS